MLSRRLFSPAATFHEDPTASQAFSMKTSGRSDEWFGTVVPGSVGAAVYKPAEETAIRQVQRGNRPLKLITRPERA